MNDKLRIFLLFLPFVTVFETALPGQDLKAFLQSSATHNIKILEERKKLAVVKAAVIKSVAGVEPKLSVEGDVAAGKDIVTGGTALENSLLRSSVPKASFDVNLDQPIYSGKAYANISASVSAVRAAQFKLDSVEQDTVLTVAKDYVDCYADQVDQQDAERIVDIFQQILTGVRASALRGEAARIDILSAEANLDEAASDLAQARSKLADDAATLEQETRIKPAKLLKPELAVVRMDDDLQFDDLVANNPDIWSAKFHARSDKSLVDAALGEGRPTVDLEADYHRRYGAVFPSERESVQSVTLRVKVPLFSGGAVRGDVEEKRAQEGEDLLEIREAMEKAEVDARSNFEKSRLLTHALADFEHSLAQKNMVAAGQHALFDRQEANMQDILMAEKSAMDTDRKRVRAYHDLFVANANLRRAMGHMRWSDMDAGPDDPAITNGSHDLVRHAITLPFISRSN